MCGGGKLIHNHHGYPTHTTLPVDHHAPHILRLVLQPCILRIIHAQVCKTPLCIRRAALKNRTPRHPHRHSLSRSCSLLLRWSVINNIPRRCVPSSIGEQTTGLGFAANGACCAAADPFLSASGGELCKSGVCGKKDPAVDKWNTCQPAVNFLASTRKVKLACTARLNPLPRNSPTSQSLCRGVQSVLRPKHICSHLVWHTSLHARTLILLTRTVHTHSLRSLSLC